MAIVLGEARADACIDCLASHTRILISAATIAESLIVADRRGVGAQMARLIDGLGFECIAVSSATARRVALVYARFGKGVHPAGLNFGDCFAYDVAHDHGCALVFVGDDFSRTDIGCAL